MAESVCIAVPMTCRDGSAPYLLTPRLDATGRVALGPFVLSPHAAVQVALALYAVAAPLVDAEACAADPHTLPLFGEAA